jgi:hypothetical protein
MHKSIALVIIGLAAGFAVAAWWGGSSRAPVPGSANGLDVEQRLDALEADLAVEVRRRTELEAELAALSAQVAPATDATVIASSQIGSSTRPSDSRSDSAGAAEENARAEATVPPGARRRPPFAVDDSELVERIVAAGISPERAQWIVARTQELRMEALQAQYDAAREGRPIDPSQALSPTAALREELGDADYERYLQALGVPTNVYVGDVLATSPAAQAGIKPGDQIVRFDGKRVFAMSDINRLVLEGEPGQMVAVDIMRDGQLVQLYVPRGPIGIAGGGPRPGFRPQ